MCKQTVSLSLMNGSMFRQAMLLLLNALAMKLIQEHQEVDVWPTVVVGDSSNQSNCCYHRILCSMYHY